MYKKLKAESKSELKLEVVLNKDEFKQTIQKVYEANKKHFKLHGFRAGKVPFQYIVKYYGIEIFFEDAVKEGLTVEIEKFFEENKDVKATLLNVEPVISVKEVSEEGFTAEVVYQLKPEVKLGEYKGIEIEVESKEISEKEVEEVLANEAKSNARLESVNKKAKKNNIANIDFVGYTKNEKGELVEFEGGAGNGYDLALGSNTFIPGFEDQLIGTKAGEEKDVVVTFPVEYHSEALAGKEATFKVKVNEIKEEILPAIDEEFAKDAGFETLEEYKKDIKKTLENQLEKEMEQKKSVKVAEKLKETSKVEISDQEAESLFATMMESFAAQGISLEMFASMTGKTQEELKKEYMSDIKENQKVQYILLEIAKKEKIELTEEELDNELMLKAMSFADRPSVEKLKEYDQIVTEVSNNAIVKKAMDFVVSKAKVKEVKAKKETKKAAPKKETAKKTTKKEEK